MSIMKTPVRDTSFIPIEEEYDEFSIDEIINGTKDSSIDENSRSSFPGLVGLVYNYLDSLNVDVESRYELGLYLDLVAARANGSLITTATFIRNYIKSHPEYRQDSRITPRMNFDLMHLLDEIEKGNRQAPGLLPDFYASRQKRATAEATNAARTSSVNQQPANSN